MILVTTDEIRVRFNFGIGKKKFYEFREIYLFPDPVKIVKPMTYNAVLSGKPPRTEL